MFRGKLRVSWTRILASAVIAAGLAVVAEQPVQAVGGLTGICQSNPGGSPNACWKETSGGATDDWPRDISGDTGQQFNVTFLGVGFCGAYPGIGAFQFQSRFDGKYIGAGFKSGGLYYVGGQRNPDIYSIWVWANNGTLQNCGDENATGQNYLIQPVNFYNQYDTAAATQGVEFQKVDPPRHH